MTANNIDIFGIGLMSGTSLDGLDIALVKFNFQKDNYWKHETIATKTINYSTKEQKRLAEASISSPIDLIKTSNWFGDFCGDAINEFIKFHQVNIDFIASHGHTVFHMPAEHYTLQIGNGANIYAKTAIPVIADFRTVDIALGGQGAPLVPIGDKLLFSDFELCLNLGGIANISFEKNKEYIAYDICPINIVLNYLCKQISPELAYDNEGGIAQSGVIIPLLLKKLNSLDYYHAPYPKSLGKEWVDKDFFPIIKQFELEKVADLLHTCVVHFSEQIARVALDFSASSVKKKPNLLVTGGGAFNKFLIHHIEQRLGNHIELVVPDSKIINYKEAIIFSFLGLLRICNSTNAIQSVTGARQDSIGGAIYGNIKGLINKLYHLQYID
ncbi:MAG: anhydro-N-acetylmuramic acid kinase [Cytophagales bacterium]|nr:MAG: anhydro-N-acetylmuramic acid kinase [Cytophagales bacterium]